MHTFMARFVRPNGDRGVIFVMAASAALALLDVVEQQRPVSTVTVAPRRRAALLVAKPGRPPKKLPRKA